MTETDYAVIIGLQNYPGLDDPANGRQALSGPENDAKGFKDWIVSPDGGNVPKQNTKLILSSDYTPVKEEDLYRAQPAELEVAEGFRTLRRISLRNQRNGAGSRVGRRLYIFMSGHGIAPNTYGNKIEKESALLMSNVDPTNVGAPSYHIPGLFTASWFCENDCFEEVFLFMDCCRDITLVPALNVYLPAKGNKNDTTRFYAFATRWSLRSREKMIDGKMQGIFTRTLLLGLNGACAEPDAGNPGQGIITGSSLKSYLYSNMKEFIAPQFLNDPQGQEPDIDYFPKANDARDIIIKKVPLLKFPLLVNVPANASGDIKVMNDKLFPIAIATISNPPQVFHFDLPRGVYLVMGSVNNNAASIRVEMKGIESQGNEAQVSL